MTRAFATILLAFAVMAASCVASSRATLAETTRDILIRVRPAMLGYDLDVVYEVSVSCYVGATAPGANGFAYRTELGSGHRTVFGGHAERRFQNVVTLHILPNRSAGSGRPLSAAAFYFCSIDYRCYSNRFRSPRAGLPDDPAFADRHEACLLYDAARSVRSVSGPVPEGWD